ncbi:hypothetical protein Q4I30_005024 [Leishmania utingensis]|uniref:Guanine nucleotide-binding protein subunit beta-like protein n=1 Tax=Leishmania utingensis TaxID=653362 RepID=A0AAW3ABJ9_9TRYP
MQEALFSINVLRSPFGVRGVQLVPTSDVRVAVTKESTVTDAPFMDNYAQVLPVYKHPEVATRRSYAVSGTRGIQQLVANTRSASLPSPSFLVAAPQVKRRENFLPSTTPQLQVISKHEKGRLLVWNGLTGAVDAACLLPPSFTVHHCAIAASYVYTTVESSAAASGAEEEACVYVWARPSFRGVTVLRGHGSRLTALGVWPMETFTLIATASLDGTMRLWRHQHNPHLWNDVLAGEDPVQLLWVLTTAELGNVHSLMFLSADTVVVTATRCALAFVRFPDAPAKWKGRCSVVSMGTVDTPVFQTVRSIVDPDGGTTFLHVCPFNRTRDGVVAATAALALFNAFPSVVSPSPQVNGAAAALSSTTYLLTGSTSGFIQEWEVNVEGTASAGAQPHLAASSTMPVYVNVKCRWYHKAHSATVNCLVTDENVVVSTSFFDHTCLYHRKSGATCTISSTAAVPLLVPQRKELVWGTIDGALSVASYAHFASGAMKEVQLLWTAKPHATAIRGVCLSLTPNLCWDTLCTGAADGSMCVWRAAPEVEQVAASCGAAKEKGAAPLISRILHLLVLPSHTVEKVGSSVKQVTALVAGLKAVSADKQGSILVVELTATGGLGQVTDVPIKGSKEVSCARLCCCDKGTLSLWVGTPCGQILHAVKQRAQKAWSALTPVHWDTKPNGSVASIADDAAFSTIMVAVAEPVAASRASQRLYLSALQLDPKAAAPTVLSLWEGAVVLCGTASAANRRERTFSMTWLSRVDPDEQASPSTNDGLLVCGSDGTVVSCFRRRMANAATRVGAWQTPEVLIMASLVGEPDIIQRNFDESPSLLATAVTAQSRNSDLLCLDVFENRSRVLVPLKVRTTQLTTILCDVGTPKVRLAAVRQKKSDHASEVTLFNDAGRECGRVTYDGAVVLNNDVTGTSASMEKLSYTPKAQGLPLRRPSVEVTAGTAALTADCTVIAAHAGERIIFIGYENGLLQLVDTTDVYVFCRRWATDASGVAQPIAEVRYGGSGVVVVRLANNHLCSFAIPPRSLLDQPSLSQNV